MIFFSKEKLERVIDRRALGVQSLVIAEDLECGDFAMLDVDQEKRQFELRKGTEEELAEHLSENNNEQELRFLTDRISPVKNLTKMFNKPTRLEVTFMGDLMLVDLKEGAVFVDHPDVKGETLFANIKMPELEDTNKTITSEYTWQTATKLKNTFKRWCAVDKPEDYIFVVEISNTDGVVSFKPIEMYDISLGEINKILEARKTIEAKKTEQEVKRVITQSSYDDDEYEDEYEDLGTGITDSDDDDDDAEYDGFYE